MWANFFLCVNPIHGHLTRNFFWPFCSSRKLVEAASLSIVLRIAFIISMERRSLEHSTTWIKSWKKEESFRWLTTESKGMSKFTSVLQQRIQLKFSNLHLLWHCCKSYFLDNTLHSLLVWFVNFCPSLRRTKNVYFNSSETFRIQERQQRNLCSNSHY